MTEPQVPRIPDILTPAVDALTVDAGFLGDELIARVRAANHGHYSDVLRGFAAQAAVARARFTREIIAGRLLPQNTGQALRELAASEFFVSMVEEPQYAIGHVELVRTVTTPYPITSGTFLQGVIAAGTRITRPKGEVNGLSWSDADYYTTEALVCGADDSEDPVYDGTNFVHTQRATVPIIAARPGPEANCVYQLSPASNPVTFDAALPAAQRWKGNTLQAAGGMISVPDAQIIDLCNAMGTGYSGGNTGAVLAGARSDARVRRVAYVMDYGTATLRLFVADQSWASADRFVASVKQGLFDREWIPFGGVVRAGPIYNTPVTVSANVYLRNRAYQAERSEITAAILREVTTYLDDRADFYTWNLDAIGGVIAKADARVITCSSPKVLSQGIELAEPPLNIAGSVSYLTHYLLTAVNLTFLDPGS